MILKLATGMRVELPLLESTWRRGLPWGELLARQGLAAYRKVALPKKRKRKL